MAKLFTFEVHSPYRLFFSDEVEGITVNLEDGEMGVYADHSFVTAPVLIGILKIKDKTGVWKSAYISEGILEVSGHKTILMVDSAEWPEEIDHPRAIAARDKAKEKLDAGVLMKFETAAARADLKRAEFRLKAYELRGKGAEDVRPRDSNP